MSAAATAIVGTGDDLLGAYAEHCSTLGLSRSGRDERLAAARGFLNRFPDLTVWMARPLPLRLADLDRAPQAWSLIAFAAFTGRVRVDFDLLAAKHVGRSFGPAIFALFPEDVAVLGEAATRLRWAETWTGAVLGNSLPLVVAATGRAPRQLTSGDIEAVRAAVRDSPYYRPSARRRRRSHLHSLARLLFEARIIDTPPIHRRGEGPGNLESRLAVVAAEDIRRVMLSYLQAKQPLVRVSSIRNLASHLAAFGEFLTERYPHLTSLSQLERGHIEAYCQHVPTRHWRGQRACDNRIGTHSIIAGLVAVRGFLDDIAAWGWAEAPPRRVMFANDIPRPPQQLPRALSPDVDAALMAAVAGLSDRFARAGLTVLRGTGLRLGELLDLELDCVVDYGPAGQWLRVPLGKLNSERSIPLDAATLAAITEWRAHRGVQRALPHTRDGRPTDFLFVERGRRPGKARITRGLADAVRAAGLTGPDGDPLHVTAHQLRHTYASGFANAGMSMQALMALLGHTSPEMTLRYATLASPTLRDAYETAMGRMRPQLPLAPAGRPAIPDRVQWLNSEMLKTRVAHGYCARELAAEACPYANICETCENFIPAAEFAHVLQAQLADVRALREDATTRGWTFEAARHQRVAASLENHLRHLSDTPSQPLDPPTRAG
jgi:integrase